MFFNSFDFAHRKASRPCDMYYAHLAATRGREYLWGSGGGSEADTSSIRSGGALDHGQVAASPASMDITPAVKNTMFWV